MKRLLLMSALFGLIVASCGCSNGFLRGGLINQFSGGCGATGPFETGFLSDGPVRRWLRGDQCDTCNVPAGQITSPAPTGFNCESGLCGTSPVLAAPGLPATGLAADVAPGPLSPPITTGYAPAASAADGSGNRVSIPDLNTNYANEFFDGAESAPAAGFN